MSRNRLDIAYDKLDDKNKELLLEGTKNFLSFIFWHKGSKDVISSIHYKSIEFIVLQCVGLKSFEFTKSITDDYIEKWIKSGVAEKIKLSKSPSDIEIKLTSEGERLVRDANSQFLPSLGFFKNFWTHKVEELTTFWV